MSVELQGDFSNYFDMVQDKATQSQFYLDIQKHFNEGKIDGKIYASLMMEFHKDTLSQAIETGRTMSLGVRELELKVNESVASVANTVRRTEAIGEELFIKGADSASSRAVNTERILGMVEDKANTVRRTEAIGEELLIKSADSESVRAVNRARIVEFNREYELNQARANREISESAKKIEVDEARRLLVIRQKNGYEDNLRIKKAEHASGVYGMIESGGNESPQKLVDLVMLSLNDI